VLEVQQFQVRENRWVIADLIGKAGHIRTIPVPQWVKAAVDDMPAASCEGLPSVSIPSRAVSVCYVFYLFISNLAYLSCGLLQVPHVTICERALKGMR